MRRIFSVLLMMGGLVMAGGASAAVFLGNFNANCGNANTSNAVSGNVGDTFSVTAQSLACTFSSTTSGVVTGPGAVNPSGPATYTLASAGTTTATFLAGSSGLTLTVTVASPTPPTPPQPIPTLSEWAQIIMMLAMIATAGFYGWRMKQR